MPSFFLSDDDVKVLKRLLADAERLGFGRTVDKPTRTPNTRTDDDDRGYYQAPEMYVARPNDSTGLPARSGTTPGKVECSIYRIIDQSGTLTLVDNEGTDKDVHNIFELGIGQTYIPVWRDKWGNWIATPPGVSRVHFTIYSFDFATKIATCTPKYAFCGSLIPGKDANGRITVADPSGCYYGTETAAALLGRWGHADWAVKLDEEPVPPCGWIISGLCCPD